MTVTGHGLESVSFEREKTDAGEVDRDYTGRILRIRPESGGEILLRISASQVMLLAVAVDQVRKSLVHTSDGWKNVYPTQT
jgi:hypothetical protein